MLCVQNCCPAFFPVSSSMALKSLTIKDLKRVSTLWSKRVWSQANNISLRTQKSSTFPRGSECLNAVTTEHDLIIPHPSTTLKANVVSMLSCLLCVFLSRSVAKASWTPTLTTFESVYAVQTSWMSLWKCFGWNFHTTRNIPETAFAYPHFRMLHVQTVKDLRFPPDSARGHPFCSCVFGCLAAQCPKLPQNPP